MGGLLSALDNAATALTAFSQELGVSQQNVANASTPGYASRTAVVAAIGLAGIGGGTNSANGDYIEVTSSSNSFADAAVQAASSQASASQTLTQQLTSVNGLFDITGASGILAAFQKFSTAFSNLAVTPSDPTAGAAALSAAGSVATAFNSVAGSLNAQQSQVSSQIQSTTAQINALATQIQQLNVQTTSQPGNGAAIDTRLRNTLDQLSTLVDINVTKNADGSVSVLAGGQLPLVLGDQAFQLSTNPSASPGSQVSSSAGGNSPASFSGQLGALLQTGAAIGELTGNASGSGTLNQLASGFASQVNALLTSGVNASGGAGVPVFTLSGNPADAAGSLALDPTVTADQLGLASVASGTAPAEANGIANQLAALASSTTPASQINGLSAEGLFGSIAASVGQQLSDATSASTTDQTTLTQAQTNRQQQIGVSLDQQAVDITQSQRAYEANAQVVTILNQLTQDTINIISATSG